MTVGKGDYDEICSFVRNLTSADAVALLVVGPSGTGASIQTCDHEGSLAAAARSLATMLRQLADGMDRDAAALEAQEREHLS